MERRLFEHFSSNFPKDEEQSFNRSLATNFYSLTGNNQPTTNPPGKIHMTTSRDLKFQFTWPSHGALKSWGLYTQSVPTNPQRQCSVWQSHSVTGKGQAAWTSPHPTPPGPAAGWAHKAAPSRDPEAKPRAGLGPRALHRHSPAPPGSLARLEQRADVAVLLPRASSCCRRQSYRGDAKLPWTLLHRSMLACVDRGLPQENKKMGLIVD